MELTKKRGFTLIELMVVVAIILLLSVAGGLSLKSRLKVSKLDEAAKILAADITYARTSAMLKGCPSRILFCATKNCDPAGANPGVRPTGELDADFFTIMRLSQVAGTCQNADASTTDGWNNWDIDRRPQGLPGGYSFTAIYGSGHDNILNNDDWDDASLSTATTNSIASLWFSTQGRLNGGGAHHFQSVDGNFILFQIQEEGCNPADSDDCPGQFVLISPGGVTSTRACHKGTGGPAAYVCID